MCGILANFSKQQVDVHLFRQLSKKISHRGSSAYGLTSINGESQFENDFESLNFDKISLKSTGVLYHNLHSITGFQIQPLVHKNNNSRLIFNGEIYNYKQLAEKLHISSTSDSSVLHYFLDSFSTEELLENISTILDQLDGDYAFCYQRGKYVFLARDLLGVKPLLYSLNEHNFFCISERTDLLSHLEEVNPKEVVVFNTDDFTIQKLKRNFYELKEEHTQSLEELQDTTWKLLVESVKKRIPENKDKKVGLLFSGGIDSTVIALILKQLGVDFVCYTAKMKSKTHEEAEDFIYSKEIAKKYDLNLKYEEVDLDDLEELTKDVISIIDEREYIKVSVSLPFLASCRLAQKDGVDVMFSGLGSEEIFAGYRRHKQAENINLECLKGLDILHVRDLYRDDVITMSCTQELRVPFLDKELIEYCLQIPAKYKIDMEKIAEIKDEVYKKPYLNSEVESKIILRECAIKFLDLELKFARRQKKAAQYGSKFDKGLLRLAKNRGVFKQEYLNDL